MGDGTTAAWGSILVAVAAFGFAKMKFAVAVFLLFFSLCALSLLRILPSTRMFPLWGKLVSLPDPENETESEK